MAPARTSWVLLLLLLLLTATGEAATINITNRCSYTVWPAAVPIGGGVRLDPGNSWTLEVPTGATSGGQRIWPRTGCSFDGKGNGSCQTGDCGGLLSCKGYGQPPNTLAEFTIGQGKTTDLFDLSLVDGFNVPMEFLPVQTQGGPGCSKGPRCAANITSQCPSQLQAPGGCNNPCTVFKQDRYCCTGNSSNCEPTTYSLLFVRMCPDAYSYSNDDSSSTVFTCTTGTNYQVVFCPPVDLTSSPPDSPVPTGYLAPEWLTSHITEKADVYSFGVVVMEIVSGRKNLDTSRSDESLHLITILEEKVKSDQLVDLIDKNSNDVQAHEQEVIQMMKLAMWCLQIDCKRRPQMSEVVKVLEGTKNAETNIEHNFVARSLANFGIARNMSFSAPPLASDVSGPR